MYIKLFHILSIRIHGMHLSNSLATHLSHVRHFLVDFGVGDLWSEIRCINNVDYITYL